MTSSPEFGGIDPVAIAHIGGETAAMAFENAKDPDTRAETVDAVNEELEPQGVVVVDLHDRQFSNTEDLITARLERLVQKGILDAKDTDMRRRRVTAVLRKRLRSY